MYTLGKRYQFAAAHTLCSPHLTDEENRRVYGKCAYPTGHGHDYVVEVMLTSDLLTGGTVIGRGTLDSLIDSQIAPRFSMQDLNRSFGRGFITSGENLVVAIHSLLLPHLPSGVTLTVRITETEKNSFVYHGANAGGLNGA